MSPPPSRPAAERGPGHAVAVRPSVGWAAKAPDQTDGLFLNCPRCGLSIVPRAERLRFEHCPRCLAHSGTRIELFASGLPTQALYRDGHAPATVHPIGHRPRQDR